jgi:hypothetical protein
MTVNEVCPYLKKPQTKKPKLAISLGFKFGGRIVR